MSGEAGAGEERDPTIAVPRGRRLTESGSSHHVAAEAKGPADVLAARAERFLLGRPDTLVRDNGRPARPRVTVSCTSGRRPHLLLGLGTGRPTRQRADGDNPLSPKLP